MQYLSSFFRRHSYTKPEMIEMVSRGMQVRRVNGHNYVIRFYHQSDLDEEEDTRNEYNKKRDEYYEKPKENDVESNIEMPVYLDMVKLAKPYSTMTLYQDNPNITGGPLHIVKKDIVCGSLHVLIANQYEKDYVSEDGKRKFDYGHDDCDGTQIYAGWYAHYDNPKTCDSKRRSVTYVRFYDFREEMEKKPREKRTICFVDNKDGDSVWVEGQNGQHANRNNNNNMKEEPEHYDEKSKQLGARTLKETLDSCISVFESTYDTWRRGPQDLNPMVVETINTIVDNTIVGNVVGLYDLPQHVAHRRQNAARDVPHDVKIINKTPVKRRKSNRERPFNPVMKTTVQPYPKHPEVKKQPTTEELIGRMPYVPTGKINIGNDKRDSKKRAADMVNYQMNLKF